MSQTLATAQKLLNCECKIKEVKSSTADTAYFIYDIIKYF